MHQGWDAVSPIEGQGDPGYCTHSLPPHPFLGHAFPYPHWRGKGEAPSIGNLFFPLLPFQGGTNVFENAEQFGFLE